MKNNYKLISFSHLMRESIGNERTRKVSVAIIKILYLYFINLCIDLIRKKVLSWRIMYNFCQNNCFWPTQKRWFKVQIFPIWKVALLLWVHLRKLLTKNLQHTRYKYISIQKWKLLCLWKNSICNWCPSDFKRNSIDTVQVYTAKTTMTLYV